MKPRLTLNFETVIEDGSIHNKITVTVNDEHRGEYYVPIDESVVEEGLLLAGYSKVETSGAGWKPDEFSREDLLASIAQRGGNVSPAADGSLGEIHLKKCFWVGIDHAILDIFVNGSGKWDTARPDMNFTTLSKVLQVVGFEVTQTFLATSMPEIAAPAVAALAAITATA